MSYSERVINKVQNELEELIGEIKISEQTSSSNPSNLISFEVDDIHYEILLTLSDSDFTITLNSLDEIPITYNSKDDYKMTRPFDDGYVIAHIIYFYILDIANKTIDIDKTETQPLLTEGILYPERKPMTL